MKSSAKILKAIKVIYDLVVKENLTKEEINIIIGCSIIQDLYDADNPKELK